MSIKVEGVVYKPAYPGETLVGENRRKYLDPSYKPKKLRSISDEDLIAILGHRKPGEAYKSVHPPLDEIGEPECPIRELVEPTPGAKAGDRIRFIQFTDSVYFAPLAPYVRTWVLYWRYRGVDAGTLSGRAPLEMRERDLELVSKDFIETEFFDPARVGIRGATVHGHALRLDEHGLMFDAIRRYVYDEKTGEVVYVKDQVGIPIERPVSVGKPLPEEELKKLTTIYRSDGISTRDDKELLKFVHRLHTLRTLAGFKLSKSEGV
ncbi:MAG: coenzyme-B sulfoethylthiotransferase subunit gamma [Candidatus Korarchaeum sp.]